MARFEKQILNDSLLHGSPLDRVQSEIACFQRQCRLGMGGALPEQRKAKEENDTPESCADHIAKNTK
jgi:hypothetical protein